MGMSYSGVIDSALVVTETIEGAHPKLTDYPLLRGDIVSQRADGTWGKYGPGLGIEGFRLTDEQVATLEVKENIAVGIGNLAWFLGGE